MDDKVIEMWLIIAVCGFAILVIIIKSIWFPAPYITLATYDKDKKVLSVKYSNDTLVQYYLDGAVWLSYPMMRFVENQSELEGLYKYINVHGNPWPTAHLNRED
jgi:hypothetical protein